MVTHKLLNCRQAASFVNERIFPFALLGKFSRLCLLSVALATSPRVPVTNCSTATFLIRKKIFRCQCNDWDGFLSNPNKNKIILLVKNEQQDDREKMMVMQVMVYMGLV